MKKIDLDQIPHFKYPESGASVQRKPLIHW